MTTGAIILAAGQNRKIGEFQPMLPVSGTSMIKKQISTLRQAGVTHFVVVTGYQAEQLEKHLAHRSVTFIRNENYENGEMLDSIKCGIRSIAGEWEQTLLLPADLPFFTVETVTCLMESQGAAVVPVYQGRKGHPILLRNLLYEQILTYQGENGLRGVFALTGEKPVFIDTEDKGILLEANTGEQYQELLNYEEVSRMEMPLQVQIRASILRRENCFDEDLAAFLKLVEQRGSMLAAGQELKMAYSRVWKMVGNAEEQLGFPLVERQAGGSRGGSTKLTEQGRAFIAAYQEFHEELEKAAEKIYRETIGRKFF